MTTFTKSYVEREALFAVVAAGPKFQVQAENQSRLEPSSLNRLLGFKEPGQYFEPTQTDIQLQCWADVKSKAGFQCRAASIEQGSPYQSITNTVRAKTIFLLLDDAGRQEDLASGTGKGGDR
jgi:hypothetical protein